MNALVTYLKNVRVELAHVAWPSTRTAVAHTLVVIVIAVTVALFVSLLDYGFAGIVGRLIGGY
jgi:preprotein translocase SecE subunit